MKKTIIFICLATLLCACKKNDSPNRGTKGVTFIADYLYYMNPIDYGTMPPADILRLPILKSSVKFGCSSVRNGDFYGRNLDVNINEICEFVIRTKATDTRHASIAIANPTIVEVTADMITSGLNDEILRFIPWMTMDGINDAGLVCNINVVNMSDLETHHSHTHKGLPEIMVMHLPRFILDNCGSVDEALSTIDKYDITPMLGPLGGGWDGHLMIADENKTVIVEFLEGDTKVTETNIMTNFYNYQYALTGEYPLHGCGIERYKILSDNYNSGNSMEGMWNLMKMVQYTKTYSLETDPFWCSEYYDVVWDEDGNQGNTSWTKEEILAEPVPQIEMVAYQIYKDTGIYDPENNLWHTTHNSVFNIKTKELWVTVHEKYGYIHKFKLNQ
ncbi:MAG: linear amide C-N hydrolase [Paludibacteraceae bacterium]|nr:linear amide C-N hydrolase [Paludibacteraceae bacterium]